MSEEEKLPQNPEMPPENDATPEPVAYASPLKRIWAWVGVVYMVIIVFLMTYLFANARYLQGIGSLMVVPALAGVAASSVWIWREGAHRDLPRAILLGLILAACVVLAILGLVNGIPALVANFGG